MKLKDKTFCVCGGAGFIGSHLVDRLREEEPKKIIVLTNFYLGKLSNLTDIHSLNGITIIKADLTDQFNIRKIFRDELIDIVFNCAVVPLPASLTEPVWTFLQNIKITLNLCEILREGLFQTLIQFSSSEVYGSTIHASIKEDHPCNPTTPYGASKLATDHIVLSYHKTFNLDIAVIRPFNTYGPRQNSGMYAGLIPVVVNNILNCKPININGDGEQTRDYVYVSDVVKAAVEICKNEKIRGIVLNIGSGRELSINQIVDTIYDQMKSDVEIIHQAPRPGEVRRLIADISLAEIMIGYKPKVNFEEGIRKTIKWYEESGSRSTFTAIRQLEKTFQSEPLQK